MNTETSLAKKPDSARGIGGERRSKQVTKRKVNRER
jgi:hypothetical protein